MVSRKIAIYSGEIPSTTFVERLVEGMAAYGHEIYLFGQLKRRKEYARNVTVIAYGNKIGKLCHFLYYTILLFVFRYQEKKKLDRILAKEKKDSIFNKTKFYPVLYYRPEIFHLQWGKGIDDWMWLQEFGTRLILSLRGTHITISPIGNQHWAEVYAKTFPKIDGFHAVSDAIGVVAQQYGANSGKIKTLYSGLDFKKFPFHSKTHLNTPLKIVSIGRPHWVKGYHYALDAFSVLQQRQFDFEYTIIGIGIHEELLVQRSQLGLENQVHFIPQIPFDAVVSAICNADVVLLSSVEEGIANVVLEAMALGTIVISADCGGMHEVIQDGENGFLVPVRNPLAIAEVLLKVSGLSMKEYREISIAARQTVVNQHQDKKMIAGMEALYETVLNETL